MKLIDANGNSLTYYYDNLGNLQKVVEPTKNTILVKLEYDENENLISREDGNKNLKKLTYDGQTRITEVSHWDKKGDILSETQIAYDEAFYDESENPFFKVTVTQKGDTQDRQQKSQNTKNGRSFSFKKKFNGKKKGFKKKFFNKKKRFLGKRQNFRD